MKLYIGVTKDDELYFIEWDRVKNQQKNTFSLCGGCYNEPVTEEEGENKAREVLNNSSYWEDLGYLSNSPNILTSHINFNEVAEEVLNIDGWENTNGEYSHFGEYKGEEIYLNYSCSGQHKEEIKDLKECWVEKSDLKKVYSLWDNEHLKPLKQNTLKFMNSFFKKNKVLCSDEEVLNKYLNCIKWRQ